ncbi:hypothetical protein CAEBREN_16270 [Caenorhabditis brenneri]|uniref:Uncharacterized protein n=1 Tax=Caenorhabditis brenneri TaxID=135651 RepID=G0P3Q8_CAEBE|nr:hypothetical protein CAEBREN_16270 [Caenorhabditis brenneri]
MTLFGGLTLLGRGLGTQIQLSQKTRLKIIKIVQKTGFWLNFGASFWILENEEETQTARHSSFSASLTRWNGLTHKADDYIGIPDTLREECYDLINFVCGLFGRPVHPITMVRFEDEGLFSSGCSHSDSKQNEGSSRNRGQQYQGSSQRQNLECIPAISLTPTTTASCICPSLLKMLTQHVHFWKPKSESTGKNSQGNTPWDHLDG